MPSLGRAPKLIIAVVAVAGAAVGVIGALSVLSTQKRQIVQLQRQLATTQQQAAQLETQNQALNGQMTTLQAERKTLDERLASLRTQLSSAQAELDQSRASLTEFQSRAQALEDDKGTLEVRVTDLMGEREEARQRADRMAEEKANVERIAARMRDRMSLLNQDYRKLSDKVAELERTTTAVNPAVNMITEVSSTPPHADSSGPPIPTASSIPEAVELPPIVVRKGQSAISMPIRGRLVEINEPHNFTVVDKGSNDGVYPGMVFDFQRGGGTVGRAKVIRVRPQLSACDIVREATPGPLQVGDVAVQGQ